MRVAGTFPERWAAAQFLKLQAKPHLPWEIPADATGLNFNKPFNGLIWRIDQREDEYVVVGRSLAELKELRK